MIIKKNVLKKVTAVVTATVLSATMLAGCGGKNASKDDQGRTVITVVKRQPTEGKQLDEMIQHKELYEEENP